MPNYDARYSDIQRVDLVAGTGLIGTMNTLAIGGGSVVSIANSAGWLVGVGSTSIVNSAGWVVSVANTGGAYTLANGTGLIGSANIFGTISVANTGGTSVVSGSLSIVNSAGWAVNVINTAGITLGASQLVAGSIRTLQYAAESTQLVAGVASIGTASVILMNTANWYVNVVNTAGLVINQANTGGQFGLYSGTGLIGTMNTLAIGGGDTVSVVNSAGWIVGLFNGTGLIGTMNTLAIGGGSLVSVANTAGWVVGLQVGSNIIGTASLMAGLSVVGSIRTLQYAPESTGLVAGVAAIGTASVILMNTANWYVNVVNTAGITLGASQLVAGSIRTLQYAAESVGLVAGVAAFGTAYVGIINTQNWVVRVTNTAGITLGAAAALVGSIRTLQYAPESTGLVAGVALVGSIRTLQYAAESVGLVAGVASVGTASVILMNTNNWTVSNRQEVMSMHSSNVTIFAYSTGIECSATNNLIIAASASRIFKVLGYSLMSAAANNARFQSGSNATTFMTGNHFFGGSGGIVMPYNPMGWFSVTAGSPLYLTLASANSVGGVISYLVM